MLSNVIEYKGFKATFVLDPTAEAFHGRVLGIEDTIDFYGKDVKELVHEFHTSIDEYIDWCREEGQEPKKSWAGKVTIRPSDEQHEAYVIAAAAAGVSLNKWMLEVLDRESHRLLPLATQKMSRSRAV
ncbi:MAG TPA: type II toxin-antitoxin system HicB family antitoxin [Rhodopila sp.]|nr:type II toxin-antitoxin system HicB family antitoxin [Rhodopila sp.]